MPSRIFNVRVSSEVYEAIEKATKARGFKDKAAWARDVIGPAILEFMPKTERDAAIEAASGPILPVHPELLQDVQPLEAAVSPAPREDPELEARITEIMAEGGSAVYAGLLARQERDRKKKR